MRINYDFGDLEAFLAVLDSGSFHLAAARLNLSQPAVTRRIRKLEDALGSQLFERTTRAVHPTLAAKRLQARAEAMLQDAQETTRAMRDDSVAFTHQRNAIVTVALVPTVLTRLMLPAMQAYQDGGGKARVRLLDGSANEVAEAVASGEADFGLSALPALDPNTQFEPLFNDQIVLAVAADEDGDPADLLSDRPLILPAKGTGNRLLIDEALARTRLLTPWHYEVNRTTTALELVARGLGVALVPLSAVTSPDITTHALPHLNMARPVGLLTRLGQSETTAVAEIKTAIRAAV